MLKYALWIIPITLTSASAQDLVQNWTTEQTKTFDQQDPGNLSYRLTGVNTFYYVYSTAITSKDQAQSDFDIVKNYLPDRAKTEHSMRIAADAVSCDSKIKAVQADVKKMTPPTLDPNTKTYSSKTLGETQADWNTNVAADYNDFTSGTPDCSKADGFAEIQTAHDHLFPASAIPSVTASISTKVCKTYTVTISEFFDGVATSRSATGIFSTTCDQLSLSAGTLLTEIQNPTYNSRSSPSQSGQFLSIENTGKFRPTIVALLNYNLPRLGHGAWSETFRMGPSTGPVFQNSQSGVSSFGWFFGGSLSIFKRLYISAGEHWGDFPDVPFGFTNGQSIPAGFGQLTPRPRHTTRFALGITFQTTDISKAFSGGTATVNTTAKP